MSLLPREIQEHYFKSQESQRLSSGLGELERLHCQLRTVLSSEPHSAIRRRRPGTSWLKASEVRCPDGAALSAEFPHR